MDSLMKKLFSLALVLALAFSLAACEDSKKGAYLVEDTRNELKTGDIATIAENETPSTGYRWTCDIPDGGIVELTSETFRRNNPGNRKPGGDGGTRHFTVKALQPGETVIQMELKRGDEVSEIRSYHIVVNAVQ